jgi:predicted RNase H-like HicB family nuclease
MGRTQQFTAILSKEEDQYVALCPELDIASQGATVEEACANLVEALDLILETTSPQEISGRLHNDVFVTRVEVKVA